ncbi:general transcription and DNA repair factor IIH subunit TFB4-like isoform X14 [Tripterygium wilfordii]|uniref:general transcription and DNA repair factor IIH subunit TFB4-like isoform X14 n=1 Tax=Tripterygium wilfordii TaxID=458696 RepID=UPI0018F84588|nr:general transcription and DNA repair factor IIH subunit TFB4-like isoform X14 [Tripterygium wilfordii]
MASARSKFYADDASLLMVLLDTNPFFWSTSSLAFSQFLSHVLAFLNSILLLNQLNQVVVIATGYSSCGYIYDSSSATNMSNENGRMPALYSSLLWSLEEFLNKDEKLSKREPEGKIASSLLSGSLSLALCYVQRVFRSGPLNPQARICGNNECNIRCTTFYGTIMHSALWLGNAGSHRFLLCRCS